MARSPGGGMIRRPAAAAAATRKRWRRCSWEVSVLMKAQGNLLRLVAACCRDPISLGEAPPLSARGKPTASTSFPEGRRLAGQSFPRSSRTGRGRVHWRESAWSGAWQPVPSVPGRRRGFPRRLPQIRTCPTKASGSSAQGGATGRETEGTTRAGGNGNRVRKDPKASHHSQPSRRRRASHFRQTPSTAARYPSVKQRTEVGLIQRVEKLPAVHVHDPTPPRAIRWCHNACNACWADRWGRKPDEPSQKSCSSSGSKARTTARWRTLSLNVGMPMGRVSLPVPCGIGTRRIGGARYVPDLARSSRAWRWSARLAR